MQEAYREGSGLREIPEARAETTGDTRSKDDEEVVENSKEEQPDNPTIDVYEDDALLWFLRNG